MRHMKQMKLFSLVVLVLLLTGCLSPKIHLTIDPNPIKVTVGQEKLENIKLKFKLSGFSLSYKLDEARIVLKDDQGKIVVEETEELNKTIPIAPGITETVTLDSISLAAIKDLNAAVYDEVLKGKEYTLTVTITGSKTTEATAKIQFQ